MMIEFSWNFSSPPLLRFLFSYYFSFSSSSSIRSVWQHTRINKCEHRRTTYILPHAHTQHRSNTIEAKEKRQRKSSPAFWHHQSANTPADVRRRYSIRSTPMTSASRNFSPSLIFFDIRAISIFNERINHFVSFRFSLRSMTRWSFAEGIRFCRRHDMCLSWSLVFYSSVYWTFTFG